MTQESILGRGNNTEEVWGERNCGVFRNWMKECRVGRILWRRCMMGREADFPESKKDLGHHVEGLGLHSKYYM